MMVTGLQILLSLGLALIFLFSAIPKLRHPKGFILAVLEYRVLPTRVGWLYARFLPPLELLLAVLLLSGTAVRSVAIVLSLLLFSFMIAIGINLARGRNLDCHCFGKAFRRSIGWELLFQDGLLLCAALVLAVIPGAWIESEPWSVIRLSGLARFGTPMLLLACVIMTVCTAGL
ncbi:MAG TPA: MauE/DoxX family redox-associated membrane protein, partial [Ktedonobacteraceae bacterium]|nr:MauE/DoxX family redox-associated membrane protein [Ktedonobacteraceae bacterium]